MRSHSRAFSYDDRHSQTDVQEILSEEMWTGPPPSRGKLERRSPSKDRSSRNFLSNFSIPSATWRSTPGPRNEPRTPHYTTVSSSLLAQRRATIDPVAERESSSLPQLPRRYSETTAEFPDFPRPASRIGGVKRKPVPALAIEDDIETVEHASWNGRTNSSGSSQSQEEEDGHEFEARVRSLSLEELFKGETGLGFLVKEVEGGSQPKLLDERSRSAHSSLSRSKFNRSSSSDTDSASTDSHFLPQLHTLAYDSDFPSIPPFDCHESTRASTPYSFEPIDKNSSRPFALVRRRQSQPLEAYGSIIPSLAGRPKRDEELLDAWMDIIVGKEEEPAKDERPALVFQARPRKIVTQDPPPRRFESAKPRPESIASIAGSLPPLRYSYDSRRSSVVSLEAVEIREDSEDGSDDFHDAMSWSSIQGPTLQALEPVLESPLLPLPPSTASTSIRFSPLPSQTKFDFRVNSKLAPRSQAFSDQLLQAANYDKQTDGTPTASKRRHSRSLSFDFLSSNKALPPRPPKSARRLSRPDVLNSS